MSDEELIARLRLYGSKFHHEFGHNDAADRIEALTKERDSLLAGHRALNIGGARLQDRAEAAEAKLAKAVEVLNALDATLDRNGWHVDSIAREDIRATLADIKGETK